MECVCWGCEGGRERLAVNGVSMHTGTIYHLLVGISSVRATCYMCIVHVHV